MPVRRALDWDSVRAAPAVGRLGLEIDRPGSPATEPPSAGLPRRSSAGGLVLTGSHPETYCTVHAAPAESKVRGHAGREWGMGMIFEFYAFLKSVYFSRIFDVIPTFGRGRHLSENGV